MAFVNLERNVMMETQAATMDVDLTDILRIILHAQEGLLPPKILVHPHAGMG
jgi:hypothetical protein